MNYLTWLVILFVAIAEGESGNDEWMLVNTTQGPVRGRRDPNGQVWAFHNIPYATAPTGKDKFKEPLPPPTWTEPFDAIDNAIVCPQVLFKPIMPPLDYIQKEDCLIANIYVPDTKEKNLSVVVHIHGGGFQFGFGNWFKANNLIKDNVIYVNFNYRLGIHGFLCLGTKDVPGNAGLKDQLALLRWVQRNIAAFGGNPNDVTVAGFSAGAVSVELLMISKSTVGLLHKAILESGSSLATFAVQSDPIEAAKDQAKNLNFTNVDDINALEEFYRTLPLDILASDMFFSRTDSTFKFSPCVERDLGNEAIIMESPRLTLEKGDYRKIPMLHGFTNMEGQFRIPFFDYWKGAMNENFSNFLPADLKFKSEDEREFVAKQIKEFYFGDKPVDNNSVLGYVNYFSDVIFTHSVLWSVKLLSQTGHDEVYLYEYSFVDEDNPVVPYTNVRGATHCAQTLAVLDCKNFTVYNEDDITEDYRNMKKSIRDIWHNFIKTGKPVSEGTLYPAWSPVHADGSPHMSLGQKLELRDKLLEERSHFWDSFYQKYYRDPILPYK